MVIVTLAFIISQTLAFLAIISDLLSFQFKKRETTILFFITSAVLLSAHYFILNKIVAGIIVFVSIIRFTTSYFSTNKNFIYLFIGLNSIVLFFTYAEIHDLIIYLGSGLLIIGVFQKNNKLMRQLMMLGTSTILLYNILIFSPMAVLAEGIFLSSNFLGYYRHYIRKN